MRVGGVNLDGILELPPGAQSVILFAHGSGSGRFSPRNNYVASVLRNSGIGTLLFDLLTNVEDQVYENRFDIDLLAERLGGATDWLLDKTEGASIGYFGASTGAAAALVASVKRPEVAAIVSRGGRPDLAWDYLGSVKAPTLLIIGGLDTDVLSLNERALEQLTGRKKLVVIPGATHLFEEPGTLEEVSKAAASWFTEFLEGISG
ncbi:MAG TPA: dienelactone hydrolase family protein [Nitrososphaerales archaeon]|nr:dienelactone hydrolase family protein [Nitrososphaerales archaeon]